MSSFTDKVCECFRSSVTDNYELDAEVVDSLCDLVANAISEVGEPAAKAPRKRGSGGAKKTGRKKSGYNVYVRMMMHDDAEIAELDHRQKMAAIGAKWKKLNSDEQQEYKDLAEQENTAAASAVEANTDEADAEDEATA